MRLKRIMILISLFLFISLAGCSEDIPRAQDVFSSYIEAWQNHEFNEMYSLLSESSKQLISEEEFITRYETIYDGIAATDIQIDVQYPEEEMISKEVEIIDFDFSGSMNSIAGDIHFSHYVTLQQEERDEVVGWYVHWNEQMIFPSLEEGDEIRVSFLQPSRGEIFDRAGHPLAINGTVVSIGLVPEQLEENKDSTIEELADLLPITMDFIEAQLNASWVQPHFFVPIAQLLEEDQELIDKAIALPGVTSQRVNSRIYPYKDIAAHLTGYVRPITAEQLEQLEEEGYTSQDILGQAGLEQVFEAKLRGERGARIFIIDANGNEKEILAEKDAVNGESFHLSIDISLQEEIYQQLKGETGTAVSLDPLTGEVLSLVNSPSYDPNAFSLDQRVTMTKYQNDPSLPLLNRFTATYSPGSAFKPITAAIGLTHEAIDPDHAEEIVGLQWRKDDSWGNYHIKRVRDPGHPVHFEDAMVYSDNIYFARLALQIGATRFEEEVSKFGFAEAIPFEYPIRAAQLTNSGQIANELLLADTGFGQGEVLINPLHLASIYSMFLNDGHILQPTLLKLESDSPTIWKENVISTEVSSLIHQSLISVVERAEGTGHSAKVPGIQIAGKTGTAELKENREVEDGQENGWFVAYTNEEAPILIAMMIEGVETIGGSRAVVEKVSRILHQRYP